MRKRYALQCSLTESRAFQSALAVCLPALALLAAFCMVPGMAGAAEKEPFRFLRAVYLLRQISPGEHWPPVVVPRNVIYNDTTNALAMHTDKTFVIGQAVRDLNAYIHKDPVACYYAAQGCSLLGDHARAARHMQNYLAKAPYRPEDYEFLTRCLYSAQDYKGTREAAALWRGIDPSCNEMRLRLVWESYRAQGSHVDAMAAVLTDPCDTWRSRVLYSDSRRTLGEAKQAEAEIQKLIREYPDNSREIQLLWNRLRAQAPPRQE